MKVTIHGLSRRTAICRFVDLPTLFDLLVLKRIYFSTIGTLEKGDPFEGGFLIKNQWNNERREDLEGRAIQLFLQLPSEIKSGDREWDFQRYEELVQGATIDDLRKHVLEMEAIAFKRRVVCSCWHFGGAESDAMWKLYGSQLGIGLVSTVGRLARCLKGNYSSVICAPNPQEYTLAPVKYVSPERVERVGGFYAKHPYCLKRKAFRHEQEVRIFHRLAEMVSGDGGINIDVDAATLLKEIILSPFNPPWVNDSLHRAIRLILEAQGFAIPIRISAHMRPPEQTSSILKTLKLDGLVASLRGGPHRIRGQPPIAMQPQK